MMPARSDRATAPSVDIQVQSPLWSEQPLAEQTVREAIATAAETLSTVEGEVSIVLTGDSEMQKLNRQWRGVDKPTNVLSFPAKAGGAKMLGDIVVAYETLQRECAEEGGHFLHHLAHLAVHGFLHLSGYDHATDAQAETMEALESKIMRALKMPDPYLARD
jgi:probable rRNA maturation factor